MQVNAELKIAELIRRIRTKADLTPAKTSNPRVMVADKQAGHQMTIGELGIHKDKTPTVTLTYDGAK